LYSPHLVHSVTVGYLSLYRKKKRGEKERLLGGEEPDGEAMEMERIQEQEQRVKKSLTHQLQVKSTGTCSRLDHRL